MKQLRYEIPKKPGPMGGLPRPSLIVTDDGWMLDGRKLGPETCSALDWVALCRHDHAGAAYTLGDLFRSIGPAYRAPRDDDLTRLAEWLRCNFDYPAPGAA